jgi:hypothetical protein
VSAVRTPASESDLTLRRIERHSVYACAALAAGAAVWTGRLDAPLGVLGGGALVWISYRGIRDGITALVEGGEAREGEAGAGGAGGTRRAAAGLVKFFTRYAILAAAAYVIMARLRLPPVAVFAGASSLVIAVTFEALRGARYPP